MLTHQEGHTLTCEMRLSDFFLTYFYIIATTKQWNNILLVRWMF